MLPGVRPVIFNMSVTGFGLTDSFVTVTFSVLTVDLTQGTETKSENGSPVIMLLVDTVPEEDLFSPLYVTREFKFEVNEKYYSMPGGPSHSISTIIVFPSSTGLSVSTATSTSPVP